MSLFRSSILVSAITLLSRFFGYIREIMMANYLGAGAVANAFHIAFRFSNVFRSFFAEGAFTASFVPIFSSKYHKNQDIALEYASNIRTILICFLLVFTLIVEWQMEFIMKFLAPGFVDNKSLFDHSVLISRISFPYLLFMSISALYGGMLSTINKFSPIAIAPIILNISMILCLIKFGNSPYVAEYLGLSVTISGTIQLFYLYKYSILSRLKLKYTTITFDKDTTSFLKTMLPGILSASIVQISLWVSTIIATFYDSAVSLFYYADRIVQLPLALIGTSVSIVLLPSLSKLKSQNNISQINNIINSSIEICMFITIPTSLFIYFLSEPITVAMFQYGKFTSEDTVKTAFLLSTMIIALPSFILNKIFTPIFYANLDTKTPFKIAVINLIISIIINIVGLLYWNNFIIIAIATVISSWIGTILMFSILCNRKWFIINLNVTYKLIIFPLIAYVSYYLVNEFCNIKFNKIISLIFGLLLMGIIYIKICLLTKITKINDIKKLFKK